MSDRILLVTAFEPFAGSPVNPSDVALKSLNEWETANCAISTLLLPVVTQVAARQVVAAMRDLEPAAVICLGESAHATGFMLEQVFVNLRDFTIPDNSGNRVSRAPVVEDGPAAYFSTLPLDRIEAALLDASMPVQWSPSAGAFLCNEVAYAALHAAAVSGEDAPLVGFIHVPQLPSQASSDPKGQATMSRDILVAGTTAIVEAVAHSLQ